MVGQMDNSIDHTHESANRVYDPEGLAPTLNTCGGGNLEPKILTCQRESILIRQATAKGYIECENGGVADFSYPTSKLRRGRVQGGGQICPTLTAGEPNIMRIEKFHQQDEVNFEDGLSRTLVAGSHGNADTYTKTVVRATDPKLLGGLGEKASNGGTQYYQHDRVYDSDGIAMAHQAQLAGGSYKYMIEEQTQGQTQYRIRKLTPKECARLMGVRDEDYDKMTVSNSQRYKQFGNSIVCDVLMAIFENMFVNDCQSNSLF